MIKRLGRVSIAPLVLLLAACGQGQSGAQVGSTISLDPTSMTASAASYGITSTCVYTAPSQVRATVLDKSGNPVNDVGITFEVTGGPVLLYDDADNDGTLTGAELNPLTVQTYLTKTGAFGTKIMFVSFGVGACATGSTTPNSYTTDLNVYSGIANAQMTITAN